MRELAVPAEAAGCCLAGKRCHARQAHVELIADEVPVVIDVNRRRVAERRIVLGADFHVSRLRQKVDKPFPSPLIHTIRNAGYMIGPEPG